MADFMPTQLIFVRHAIAVDRQEWTGAEAERPLTKKGVKRAREVFARFFSVFEPTHLVTSPYLRALETAHLVQEAHAQLHPHQAPLPLEMSAALLPEASFAQWQTYLNEKAKELPKGAVLCAVGHDPSISELFGRHLGLDRAVPFKKAGIGVLEVGTSLESCTPVALVTPSLLRE